jgi:hypothetical protein
MSKIKWMAGSCFAMILAILALGCAGKAGPGAPLNTATGQHPTNWIEVHYVGYSQTPDQCRSCHGSTTDPTQAGGISGVSCFGCHTSGLVLHPLSGWGDHMQHGRNGAQLAPVATVPPQTPVMAGFSHCQKCHGPNYTDGIAVSCKACHTKAPHPDKPWVSTSLLNSTHVETDLANAPACAQCHTLGANSDIKPLTPAPAGTAPGCFNNTLCHGMGIPVGASKSATAALHL